MIPADEGQTFQAAPLTGHRVADHQTATEGRHRTGLTRARARRNIRLKVRPRPLVRGSLLAAGVFSAAVLATSAAGQPAGRSRDAETAKLGCKLAGIRYFGAAAGKAKVCFTLTASRKTMREYDYDFCPSASKLVGTPYGRTKPVALRTDGTFSTIRAFLAAGEAGIGFVNVTFSGRVQGNRASGSLSGALPEGTKIFRCTWGAHRLSR